MDSVRDANMLTMVFKLMDRGLTGNQIEKAMKQMVGKDWKEVRVSVWLTRLRNQGHVLHNDNELTVNDLEALITGRIRLDDIGKSGYRI